jgi:hypothetical protein
MTLLRPALDGFVESFSVPSLNCTLTWDGENSVWNVFIQWSESPIPLDTPGTNDPAAAQAEADVVLWNNGYKRATVWKLDVNCIDASAIVI